MRQPLLLERNSRTIMAALAKYLPPSLLSIAQREGDDARITGMTRSLHRRLLALNVPGTLTQERRPVTSIRELTPNLDELDTQRIA